MPQYLPRPLINPAYDRMLQALEERMCLSGDSAPHRDRPFITVSYAQSIDGSIATRQRNPLRLSGKATMILTHRLRALSDAILIGIETALSDNPSLTVRLVKGKNPRPIVLDTHLRLPQQSKLAARRENRCWLVAGNTPAGCPDPSGARVLTCATGDNGLIDLPSLMQLLNVRGIRSVMVEGGARVITSFVKAGLVDQFVITVAPMLVGGLPVFDGIGLNGARRCRLDNVTYLPVGQDLVIWAHPLRER